MPHFDVTTLSSAAIRIAEHHEAPVAFAAEELRRHVQQMTGVCLQVLADASLRDRAALVLGRPSERCETPLVRRRGGFDLIPEPTRITLAGGSPRALLDAVYALLTQCGCRWSLHGAGGDTVPRLMAPTIELRAVQAGEGFATRGYCSDIMTWHYTQPELYEDRIDDDRAFVDWMGKSGANAFFFIRHPFDTQLTIAPLLPEFQRRGIDVEYGGHVVPLLVPRQLFSDHPEYFPEVDGRRMDHGNLCTSNQAALAIARDHAVQYVHDYPEMSVLHIWGADLWHGGWCRCAACGSLSAQDQSLRICNTVAQGLAEAGLVRPVCYLAYHDTIEPDVSVRPDDRVTVEFAPRERCYGHALNDPRCASNRRYAAALQRYATIFEGRVRVFEYYGDAILFFGCAVPLTHVIAADMEYYRRLGIEGITMLQFGTFSLWAYPLNFAAFAAQTRGCAASVEAYCRRVGAEAQAAAAGFAELEGLMREVVTYGDIRCPPRERAAAAAVLARVRPVLPRLRALAQHFEQLEDEALRAQAALVSYTHKVLEGVGRELSDTVAGTCTTSALYGEALQIIEAVDRRFKGLWGTVDLPIVHNFYEMATAAQ